MLESYFWVVFSLAFLAPILLSVVAGYYNCWGMQPHWSWAGEVVEWICPPLITILLIVPALLVRIQCEWEHTPVSPESQAGLLLALFVGVVVASWYGEYRRRYQTIQGVAK